MAVSQKQIAQKLGVSISLVSRVLSSKAAEIGIAQSTIDQVKQVAEELGYVPSAAALSLKGKSTRTIGVAVYDFNDSFFGALIKQIQIQAHEHNYSLVLAGFLNRIPDEQDLQPLYKYALDGLIILGSDTKADWLRNFQHLSVVRIGHGSAEENSLKITVDEDDAAQQLIQHLVAGGRKHLFFISNPLPAHRVRQLAMEKAASAAGLSLTSIVSKEKDPFDAGLQTTRRLLADQANVDVLLCATDPIAMGALHALNDANITVPDQIAVTGFDDIPTAAQFIPPILTLRQPIAEMVQRAVETITKKTDSAEMLYRAKLIVRKSAQFNSTK